MKTLKITCGLGVLLVCASVLTVALADHHESKAKHSIKEVMKNAHKGGLLKKVTAGKASQEEKLTLLDHYLSLVENKPPKGEMGSWQNLAGKAALAAAKVAVGRDGANEELKKAANCKACHSKHKK